MKKWAYYNEHDKFAAAWLRELIKAGHIADGIVDERSIEDVLPNELTEFKQCHFFAGIGGWSYALRQAGWPDDRPVWTGSCPCQPFSSAGKGAGFADERHLWPAFYHLISQCRPAIVFGEQVASKAVDAWIDLVQADLEAVGYAFGCIPFPASSVGAPHIRDRNYWVADSRCERNELGRRVGYLVCQTGNKQGEASQWQRSRNAFGDGSAVDWLADSTSSRCLESEQFSRIKYEEDGQWKSNAGRIDESIGRVADSTGKRILRESSEQHGTAAGSSGRHMHIPVISSGISGGMADSDSNRRESWGEGCETMGYREALEPDCCADGMDNSIIEGLEGQPWHGDRSDEPGRIDAEQDRPISETSAVMRPSQTNGFWRVADWLGCRDGKWRPIKPGTSALVAKLPRGMVPGRDPGIPINANSAEASKMRLKGYGNAINAEAAKAFIESYLEI